MQVSGGPAATPTTPARTRPPVPRDVQILIERDNHGQIAVGDNILQIGSNHGSVVYLQLEGDRPAELYRPRPRPLRRLPRPFRGFVGRDEERALAEQTLHNREAVEFHAPGGMGKTSLLRHLAHNAPDFDDGILYLSALDRPLADLRELLFDGFYESTIPVKLDNRRLTAELYNVNALVILDDLALGRQETQTLLDQMPSSAFLLASTERHLWGEGRAVALTGLAEEDALALFERLLGATLTAEQRERLRTLCHELDGVPLRIVETAALAEEEEDGLERLLAAVPVPPPAARLFEALDSAERHALMVLAVIDGGDLDEARLADIVSDGQAPATLAELASRGLVEETAPGRYRLAGGLALPAGWDLEPWRGRAAAYLGAWAESNRAEPERVRREVPALLVLLRWAKGAGEDNLVLRLTRALDGPLTLSKQWANWQAVLEDGLAAAAAAGDRAAAGWAHHQLGTRALCLDERAAAESHLEQALAIRTALGDTVGAELTQYHLDLLRGVPPSPKPPEDPVKPVEPHGPGGWAALSLLQKSLVVLAAIVLVGLTGLGIRQVLGRPDGGTGRTVPTEVAGGGAAREPTATPRRSTRTPRVPTEAPPPTNVQPVIMVREPDDEARVPEGTEVTFRASADDEEDGALTNQIIWYDGGKEFGRGGTVRRVLAPGAHRIEAEVSDSSGGLAHETLALVVVADEAPAVDILEPRSNAAFMAEEPIFLAVFAEDAEDGDLSDAVTWFSSQEGELGRGAELEVMLSPGDHALTAYVEDGRGNPGEDMVVITVAEDRPPEVEILSPGGGAAYSQLEFLPFEAVALDDVEGDVSDQIEWWSDIDGFVGSGGVFSVSGENLSPGEHLITAVAADGRGQEAGDERVIIIWSPPDLTAQLTILSDLEIVDDELALVAARVVVTNEGDVEASPFAVAMHYELPEDEGTVEFQVPPGSGTYYPESAEPLPPGESFTFEGEVYFFNALELGGQDVVLRAEADTCAAGSTVGWQCRVVESNEENNFSDEAVVPFPELADSEPPGEVVIYSPESDSYARDGSDENGYYVELTFDGAAFDERDGELSGESLIWTTDRDDLQDSFLGTGNAFTARLYAISCEGGATHTIRLTAIDGAGNASFTEIEIVIPDTIC